MKIILPSERVMALVKKRGLTESFDKQTKLLGANLQHPSLNVERLEPRLLGLYSFRVSRQFRGIFFFILEEDSIKIVDVNNHSGRA